MKNPFKKKHHPPPWASADSPLDHAPPKQWVGESHDDAKPQLFTKKGRGNTLKSEKRNLDVGKRLWFEGRKLKIPFLRTLKRFLAASLLIVNFVISQGALLSASITQPMFWLFILNVFILVDYLWKTRSR